MEVDPLFIRRGNVELVYWNHFHGRDVNLLIISYIKKYYAKLSGYTLALKNYLISKMAWFVPI
jgi:hypothetical protein